MLNVNMDKSNKEAEILVSQSPRLYRRKHPAQTNNESTNYLQGKVALDEVAEKLKSMRQKRLDRLSTFVAEQSKFVDEENISNKDKSEIEDAIISIKQVKEEKKLGFQPVIEEHVTTTTTATRSKGNTIPEEIVKGTSGKPRTPKLFRKFSNDSDKIKPIQKSSSTMKFISKFNCTTTDSVGSSIEDLTSNDDNKNSNSEFLNRGSNYNTPNDYKRSLQEDSGRVNVSENNSNNYNPLLSPVGKQRRGIYLYETECKFLENEKSMSTFSKWEINNQIKTSLAQPSTAVETFISQEKDTHTDHYELTPKIVTLEVKPRNVGETKGVLASGSQKSPSLLKTFKRNSLGDILDNKVANTFAFNRISADESRYVDNKNNQGITKTEVTTGVVKICESFKVPNTDNELQQANIVVNKYKSNEKDPLVQPKSPMPLPRKVYNMEPANSNDGIENTFKYTKVPDMFQQSKTDIHPVQVAGLQNKKAPSVLCRSPLPLPRKTSNEDRIFRIFQRNWDNLREIIENDSDVDSDEMEDFRKTFDEVHALVMEYKRALVMIEEKTGDRGNFRESLTALKELVNGVGKEIARFKGLKRDLSYRELKFKILNCLFEINKIKSNNTDVLKEKDLLKKDIEKYVSILECKVAKNENMLLEVLEAQVSSISTNIFNITRV